MPGIFLSRARARVKVYIYTHFRPKDRSEGPTRGSERPKRERAERTQRETEGPTDGREPASQRANARSRREREAKEGRMQDEGNADEVGECMQHE